MIDTIQDIHIEEVDGHFVATVPKIGATVTGDTHGEALENAQRAIMARMIAEAESVKLSNRKAIQGLNSSFPRAMTMYTSLLSFCNGGVFLCQKNKASFISRSSPIRSLSWLLGLSVPNKRFGYGRSLTPPLQHLIFSHNLDFGMDDQSNKDSLFRLVPVTSIIVLELFQAGLTNSDNRRELFPLTVMTDK